MTVLDDIAINKYVFVANDTSTNTVKVLTSQDGVNFSAKSDLDISSLPDINITKLGGYYYLTGTLAAYRTTDFNNFDEISLSGISNTATSLQMFQDIENLKYHLLYVDNSTVYIADYDSDSNSLSNLNQKLNITATDVNLAYFNSRYFIVTNDSKVYVSGSYLGDYTQLKTNIVNASGDKYTAPRLLDAGDYFYLYQVKNGSSITFRTALKDNPIIWNNEATVSLDDSYSSGAFIYNEAAYSDYPSYSATVENTFNTVVQVKARNTEQKAILNCLIWNTFQLQWAQNSTYQLQFTAYDNGSIAYSLVQVESSIFFNGQEYIIKTCEPDYSAGVNIKEITATHVYNEIQYVRQYNTKTGTLTYTVQDVLSYYLDNNSENTGFTYHVYGDFEKQQITDLGNSSGKDMLSQILDTWTQAIIFPDNKQINVYTPDAFAKSYGRRLDYRGNTQEVNMTVDSTNLMNKVYCIGKTKDTDDDSSDNTTTQYYFKPFFVSDQNSINTWGLHPGDAINDERFTDANSMKTYAESQLQLEPALSIELTYKTNEVPVAGEKRHLTVGEDYETDVMVIGFTWYPFSGANATVLEFDNLPASILNTQALINNRIRNVAQMAQKALNTATTATVNYISSSDPTSNNSVRVGDIWTRPLSGDDNNE